MDNNGIQADECRAMPEWLTHTNQKTVENRRGVRPANNRDFIITGHPRGDELLKFIATHLHYTHRCLTMRGTGKANARTLSLAVIKLMPWQYSLVYQHGDGSDAWQANITCVGEWISQGKYREFL